MVENRLYNYVFFDGECGLCDRSVRFILERNDDEDIVFAPIGGLAFNRLMENQEIPDTVSVLRRDGTIYLRSDATAYLLYRLGGCWKFAGLILYAIPRPLRDAGYRCVAGMRYGVVGSSKETCALLPREKRARILD